MDTDIQVAELNYTYNGKNVAFVISASYGEVSWGYDNEDTVIDSYIYDKIPNVNMKIKEYETKLHRCGRRNSYSKTDHDATFMHMKDDHMMNGQLKPAFNVQHAVNSGFIVAVGIYPNPTDVLTLKPFVESMETNLRMRFDRIVADAGYESEENLVYLKEKKIEAYIKPGNYEQLGTKKFAKQIGRKENMRYDKENDCYICFKERIGRSHSAKDTKH